MPNLTRTPVYPPDPKPARPGVYKVLAVPPQGINSLDDCDPEHLAKLMDQYGQFCHWGGGWWGHMATSPSRAAWPVNAASQGIQHKWWQGLAQDPIPRNPNWPVL